MAEIMSRRSFCQELAEYYELTRDCLRNPANERAHSLALLFSDVVTTEKHVTLIFLALMPIRMAMAILRSTSVDQEEYLEHLDHHLDMFADSLRVAGFQPSDQRPLAIKCLNDVQDDLDKDYDTMPFIRIYCSRINGQLLEILNMR